MVPVVALLAVAIALGFGLLLLVDRQTEASQAKRTVDAAQALADGIVTSTAGALASVDSNDPELMAAAWPVIGTCRTITGDLNAPSGTPPAGETANQRLTRLVRARVHSGFEEGSSDYVSKAGRGTRWTATICPERTDQTAVWSDAFLETAVPTAASTVRRTVWVRGQADVRPAAAGRTGRSRASVSKVRQSSTNWTPPEDLAIGTASFSTDLSTTLATTVQNSAVGTLITKGLLGMDGLIVDDHAKIGLRCGLLDLLNNPGLNLCVGGALGGVNGVVGTATNTLGLGALGSALGGILGIDRTVNLGSYTIAPDKVRATFESLARTHGIYLETVPGGGSNTNTSCLQGATSTPTAATFVYIKRVGDGDQYCRIPDNTTARVLVIESGRARVKGAFNGVLYAANRQEIAGATTSAEIETKRKVAPLRETIRIEHPGKVTGAVWTDGAGGQAGLYPPGANPDNGALLNVGGPKGICSLPLLGPVLQLVDGLLSGVLGLVGGILELVVGYQTEVRTVGGETTDCGLLKRALGGLTQSQLLNLFGTGQNNMQIPVSEQRTRSCKVWLVVCVTWNTWSAWTPRDTKSVNLPSLLDNLAVPNVLNQLLGTLTGLLTPWTAVERNVDRIRLAGVPLPVGAGVVPGTYRNVPPRASLVTGGT